LQYTGVLDDWTVQTASLIFAFRTWQYFPFAGSVTFGRTVTPTGL
jgi:hypothetical protein